MSPKDLELQPNESLCDRPNVDSHPSHLNPVNRLPSVDAADESDYPWQPEITVKTVIEAADGSNAGSILDPKTIKVKTRHEREESPIPVRRLSKTFTWPKKNISRSMEELGRNGSLS
jgi:hypothetical protein